MKILCYIRPWLKKKYISILNNAFKGSKIIYISDFRGIGDIWIGEYLYSKNKKTTAAISTNDIQDIQMRCRFLRNQSKETASSLIVNCYNGMRELVKRERFDLIFAPIIDNYTLDILNRVSHTEKVCWISTVGSFIQGCMRMTERGELLPIRNKIEKQEIENVLSILLKTEYKPDFQLIKEKSKLELYRFYFWRKLVDIMFDIIKTIQRDRYNYHYGTKSWYKNGKISDFIGEKVDKVFEKIDELKISYFTVYLPLHYNPEATVDYWSEYKEDAYYENRIINLVKSSDSDIVFIIKEHPAMYGKRNINFYSKLQSFKNVHIIHPYENSNELLGLVKTVVVHTGSVGVEALLRGKRVLALTKNYYSDLHPNVVYVESIYKSMLQNNVQQYSNQKFMTDLLKGHFISKSVKENQKNVDEINAYSTNIRMYYSYLESLGYSKI